MDTGGAVKNIFNDECEETEYEYFSNDSELEYTYNDSSDESRSLCRKDVTHSQPAERSAKSSFRLASRSRGKEYRVLDSDLLAKRKDRAIVQLVELLCVDRDEAQILLRHYNWDHSRVESEWFNNEDLVRVSVGLHTSTNNCGTHVFGESSPTTPSSSTKRQRLGMNPNAPTFDPISAHSRNIYCSICLEVMSTQDTAALFCGHTFCKICWSSHIEIAIADGPSSTELSCPHPKCNAKVPEKFIRNLCPRKEIFEKWNSYMIHSFVDQNRAARWCPQPGCEYAIEYPGGGVIDVLCPCPNNARPFLFCFGCGRETHRPASCSDAKRWSEKNSAESENVTWIMANTKQCPKCRLNIEKNQGCNHMTCRKQTGGCGHDFCWLCLGPWSEHGDQTGGYYNCNKYETVKNKDEKMRQDETARAAAKHELDRYMHFFERYTNHNRARKFADKTMADIQVKRELLHLIKSYRLE